MGYYRSKLNTGKHSHRTGVEEIICSLTLTHTLTHTVRECFNAHAYTHPHTHSHTRTERRLERQEVSPPTGSHSEIRARSHAGIHKEGRR